MCKGAATYYCCDSTDEQDFVMTNRTLTVQPGDGKKCTAVGVGVGALGAVAGTLSGVVCPLCLVITPALIGAGVWAVQAEKEDGHGSSIGVVSDAELLSTDLQNVSSCSGRNRAFRPRLILGAVAFTVLVETLYYSLLFR